MRSPVLIFLTLYLFSCQTGSPDPGAEKNKTQVGSVSPIPSSPLFPQPALQEIDSQILELETGLKIGAVRNPNSLKTRLALSVIPLEKAGPRWFQAMALLSLVRGGTRTYPGDAFRGRLAALGAELHLSWSGDGFIFLLDCPPGETENSIYLLLELILSPAYDQEALDETIESVKKLVDKGDPTSLILDRNFPVVEGFPAIEEDLPAPEEMRLWHQKTFQPDWATLACSSPLQIPGLLKELTRLFSLWEPVHRGPRKSRLYRELPERRLYWVDSTDKKSTSFFLLFPLGLTGTEVWSARYTLARVLAGEGAWGRLVRALSRGLDFLPSIETRALDLPSSRSMYIIRIGNVPVDYTRDVVHVIGDVLKGFLSKAVTASEMETACLNISAREGILWDDSRRSLLRILSLADGDKSAQGVKPFDLCRDALKKTTLSTIRHEAEAFLPGNTILLIEGPAQLRKSESFSDALLLRRPWRVMGGRNGNRKPGARTDYKGEDLLRGKAILTLAINSMGGVDFLRDLSTLSISSRTSWIEGFAVNEDTFISLSKLERTREFLSLSVHDVIEKGSEAIETVDGKTKPMPPSSEALFRADVEGDILWFLSRLDSDKVKVVYVGDEEWEGVRLAMIRVGPAKPRSPVLSIDVRSGLVRVLRHTTPKGRVRDVFMDFRDIQRFRHPFYIERWRRNDLVWTSVVDAVKVTSRRK